MKTPQQLKQWVRSAGGKRVITRQWSTPDQEEFMRDSPSKREFDRLHKMLVLCSTAKDIELVERIIGRSVMTRAISIPHARGLVQVAEQRKRQLKERRTIKGWWRRMHYHHGGFALSPLGFAVCAYFIIAVFIGLTLAIR